MRGGGRGGEGGGAGDARGQGWGDRGDGACLESAFVHALSWLPAPPPGGAGPGEGRVECPKCAAKLGECAAAGLPCACGLLVALPGGADPAQQDRGGAAPPPPRVWPCPPRACDAPRGPAAPLPTGGGRRAERGGPAHVREAAEAAAAELEGLQLSDSDGDGDGGGGGGKKDRRRRKMQFSKLDNVSNMGRFRDKDFHKAPVRTRRPAPAAAGGPAPAAGAGGSVGSESEGSSD